MVLPSSMDALKGGLFSKSVCQRLRRNITFYLLMASLTARTKLIFVAVKEYTNEIFVLDWKDELWCWVFGLKLSWSVTHKTLFALSDNEFVFYTVINVSRLCFISCVIICNASTRQWQWLDRYSLFGFCLQACCGMCVSCFVSSVDCLISPPCVLGLLSLSWPQQFPYANTCFTLSRSCILLPEPVHIDG